MIILFCYRWDSPLFTIQFNSELPFTEIYEALFVRKAPKPNQSTQLQPLSSNNFLFELDSKTQVIKLILILKVFTVKFNFIFF